MADSDKSREQLVAALCQSQAREELLNKLLLTSTDFFHRCTRSAFETFRIDWVHGAVEDILGFCEQELRLVGCWINFVHPGDARRVGMLLMGLRPGDTGEQEFRLVHKDGQIRWVRESYRCEADETGLGFVLYGSIKNVTQHKRMTEELRRSEKLLSNIINNTPSVIYVKDAAHRYLLINESFEKIFHVDQGGVFGKTDYDIYPQGTADSFRANDLIVLQGGRGISFEEKVLQDDGEHSYISTKFPLIDDNNEIYAICGISTDITEQKQAQQALQDASERFKRVIMSSPMGIHIFRMDESGELILTGANPAADGIFGIRHEDLLGQPLQKAFPGLAGKGILDGYRSVCRVGGIWQSNQVDYDEGESSGVFSVTAFRINASELAVFIEDVTERIEADRTIRASLEEKTLMLKEIHHRVKNNLQIISSLISLQVDKLPGEVERDAFMVMYNRVKSMALIHERLYQTGEMSSIDIAGYIDGLIRQIAGSYGATARKVAIDTDLKPVFLTIDKAIPCGLLVNELITNAFKHAFPLSEGGRLRVSMRLKGEQAVIVVDDNGRGLPRDVDLQSPGSLGMNLVVALADQLGGTLDRVETGCAGTCMRLAFPA